MSTLLTWAWGPNWWRDGWGGWQESHPKKRRCCCTLYPATLLSPAHPVRWGASFFFASKFSLQAYILNLPIGHKTSNGNVARDAVKLGDFKWKLNMNNKRRWKTWVSWLRRSQSCWVKNCGYPGDGKSWTLRPWPLAYAYIHLSAFAPWMPIFNSILLDFSIPRVPTTYLSLSFPEEIF